MPTLAVIMPSFNHAEFIEEAILSVMNQSHTDWHLYIFDNGSTDNTYEIVAPYLNDARITWHQNPENLGSFPNIVQGFARVAEDYGVCLCADDFFELHYFEAVQNAIATAPNASYYAFGWSSYFINENGAPQKMYGSIPFPKDFIGQVYLSPYFVWSNFVSFGAIVFENKKIRPVLQELLKTPIRQCGEVYLMKRLEEEYGAAYFNNSSSFFCWRRHEGQLTQKNNESRQVNIECVVEPLITTKKLPQHIEGKEDFLKVSRFLALASFLRFGAQMPLRSACQWLLSDLGKNFQFTVDFSLNGLEKEAMATAFATTLALTVEGGMPNMTRADFFEWFLALQKDFGFKNLKEIVDCANATYHGFFMPNDAATAFVRQCDVSFPVTPTALALQDYYKLLATHNITLHEAPYFDRYFASVGKIPRFELWLATDESLTSLSVTLNNLARLYYDDYSVRIFSKAALPEVLANTPKIAWQQFNDSQNFWQAFAEHLNECTADFVMVLESGDMLLPYSLPFLAERALNNPNWAAVYVDEDRLDENGNVLDPYFKPDFSADYFLAHNFVGDGVFFNVQALKKIGGLNANDPNPVYGAILRLYQQLGESAIGHLPDVLYHRWGTRILNRGSDMKKWLAAQLPSFKVEDGLIPNTFKILPQTVEENTILWIGVAVNSLSAMQNFVENTVPAFANVSQYAILVPPDLDSDVLNYLDEIDQNPPNTNLAFYLIKKNQSLPWMVNTLIENSQANAIFITRPDWVASAPNMLQEMAAFLNTPFVGALSPRLVTKTGDVLGNALILGTSGLASYFGSGTHFDALGHFGRQLITQNPSALTFDALLFRRETWIAAGGLTETWESLNAACAIDFSLKIKATGQHLAWLPWISLIALDDKRELVETIDQARLLEKWLPQLACDPFYNINFSRDAAFQITPRPQVSKIRLKEKFVPRLMAFNADEMGCGHYRVIEPFNAALKAGLVDGVLSNLHFNPFDLNVLDADTLFVQRQITDEQLVILNNYRKYADIKLVYELDDLITQVDVSSEHFVSIPKDVGQRLEKALSYCNRFVVSTEPLKEMYSRYINDIRVVPNYLDKEKWLTLKPRRRAGKKPRVGWSGGVSHRVDLLIIHEVIKRLADEVEWVFFGFVTEEIRSLVQGINGVATPQYPAQLAAMNLDLALAPLAHNAFNDCKSHLKLMEYGVLGYPVIASNFGPYQRAGFPVTLVENRAKDWINAIREHINDLNAAAQKGDELREFVIKNHMLQDHLEEWRSAWFDF